MWIRSGEQRRTVYRYGGEEGKGETRKVEVWGQKNELIESQTFVKMDNGHNSPARPASWRWPTLRQRWHTPTLTA